MKAWISAGVTCALAVLLALPAVASARPGWEEQPRSLHLFFRTTTANGYELSVETTGHRQVTLSLSKGSVLATYKTSGKVSRDGIEADFGALGALGVQFEGRPTRFSSPFGLPFLPPGLFRGRECRGRRPQQEVGSFHGTIRFEGENGYAAIDVDRVKGKMRRTYRRLCRGGLLKRNSRSASGRASASAVGKEKPNQLYLIVLDVGGHQDGRRVFFGTFGFDGSSGDPLLDEFIKTFGPFAVARTFERREGVRINRSALVFGDEGSLIVSPPKRRRVTATVAFPKPFEGTAELEQVPGSAPTWVGSLVARLPGAGAVALTGEGLKAVFCRLAPSLDSELKDDPCVKEAEETFPEAGRARLLMAQDSGSHSQALADVKLSWSR